MRVFIGYISTAAKLSSRRELLSLLQQSQKNYSSLGITGMLLYKEGNFTQVLEGEKKQVSVLLTK
jgi:Sensors of blue-light using FAD